MKYIAPVIAALAIGLVLGCGRPPQVDPQPPARPSPAVINQEAIPSPEDVPDEVRTDAVSEEEQLYEQWIGAINDTAVAVGKGDEAQAEELQKKQATIAEQIHRLPPDRQKALSEKFSSQIKQAKEREGKAKTGEPINE